MAALIGLVGSRGYADRSTLYAYQPFPDSRRSYRRRLANGKRTCRTQLLSFGGGAQVRWLFKIDDIRFQLSPMRPIAGHRQRHGVIGTSTWRIHIVHLTITA